MKSNNPKLLWLLLDVPLPPKYSKEGWIFLQKWGNTSQKILEGDMYMFSMVWVALVKHKSL
jgi:hypothetical protein